MLIGEHNFTSNALNSEKTWSSLVPDVLIHGRYHFIHGCYGITGMFPCELVLLTRSRDGHVLQLLRGRFNSAHAVCGNPGLVSGLTIDWPQSVFTGNHERAADRGPPPPLPPGNEGWDVQSDVSNLSVLHIRLSCRWTLSSWGWMCGSVDYLFFVTLEFCIENKPISSQHVTFFHLLRWCY